MTGSYRSVTAFSLAALLFVSAVVPSVFAEMQLYMNVEDDFSLFIPENWSMQKGDVVQELFAAEIVLYPDEFSVDRHDGESAMISEEFGLDFVIDSPKIAISASAGMESVFFSSIIGTDELRMQDVNGDNVLDYYTAVMSTIPYSEILGEYAASHPWGYEAGVEYYLGAVDGEGFEAYNGADIIFAFDDDDVYLVSYSSSEAEYEKYIPAFNEVTDSLVIKSVNVTAFGQNPIGTSTDKQSYSAGMLAIETDRETYTAGQTVQITGSVAQLDGHDIVMRIMGPANQLVQTDQIKVGPDRTFGSAIVLVEYPWTSLGTYAVNIQYGVGSHAQTTFELIDMPADVRP